MESRLKVYEEMFVNMNAEVGRLQSTEDNLDEQLKSLNQNIVSKEAKMKLLEDEISDRKGKLSMAEEMSNALQPQKAYWLDALKTLKEEKETLVERETVSATAAVYLMELPHAKRGLGLEVIQDAVEGCADYSDLGHTILDPCHRRNILNQQTLPGWQEDIIKKFCIVYDPHNILIDLFTEAEPSLHYIEEMNDLEAIKNAIDEATEGDTLVLNFGSNVNIIFDVIVELKKMCSNRVSIFLCLSQWTPLPSRVTFINLDSSGKELRKMALHLIAVKESNEDNGKKALEDSKAARELKMLETKLMTVIMTPKPLTQKHKIILELSTQIKEKTPISVKDDDAASVSGGSPVKKSDKEAVPSAAISSVKEIMLLPIAIIAACCDMSNVGDRPFMSLTQFVNFTIGIVSAEEIKTPEQTTAAHQIIFQRYCLAFSDRDQLLFQTFIVMHYKILLGLYNEEDMKDFINVVSGHEKKEFPVPCPDWCQAGDWHNLKKIISEQNYHLATLSLEENMDAWHQWYQNTLDSESKDCNNMTRFLNGFLYLYLLFNVNIFTNFRFWPRPCWIFDQMRPATPIATHPFWQICPTSCYCSHGCTTKLVLGLCTLLLNINLSHFIIH